MKDKYNINLLPYKDIIKYCKKYLKNNEKPKRGKPKVYEDYLILAIGIIMQMYNYSFREVIVIPIRKIELTNGTDIAYDSYVGIKRA